MQIKVRPVEGRQVLDPRTVGARQHHRLGYERRTEPFREENGERVAGKFVMGEKQPRVRFVFVGGEITVEETRDGYYRRAILEGDLDYVAHVDAKGHEKVDAVLAAATTAHVQKRSADRAAAAADDDRGAPEEAAPASDVAVHQSRRRTATT